MSAPNFNCITNSEFIYAFASYEDYKAYVEDNVMLWDIHTDEDLKAFLDAPDIYHEWLECEKEFYLGYLREELEHMAPCDGKIMAVFSDFEPARIYDGEEVGTVETFFDFGGGRFLVEVSINFEAGYYEGFALDWHIKTIEGYNSYSCCSFDEMPDVEGCAELLTEETELNAGICKALAPKLARRIDESLKTVTGTIEKALKKISPYHLTGCVACNGEGFYQNHTA